MGGVIRLKDSQLKAMFAKKMEFDPTTLGNFRAKKESAKYLHCSSGEKALSWMSKEFFEKTDKQLLKEFKAEAKRQNLLPKLKGKDGHEELMKARRKYKERKSEK